MSDWRPAAQTTARPTTDHAALAAARWRIGLGLTAAMTAIAMVFTSCSSAYGKGFLGSILVPGLSVGIALGVLVILAAWALILAYVRWANAHYDRGGRDQRGPRMNGAIGEPTGLATFFFFVFIAASLGITYFAARRTKSAEDFYAAGHKSDGTAEPDSRWPATT
ncbi:MAG: DUF485 domain-containing protein [Vicinamibacterales bacterium]